MRELLLCAGLGTGAALLVEILWWGVRGGWVSAVGARSVAHLLLLWAVVLPWLPLPEWQSFTLSSGGDWGPSALFQVGAPSGSPPSVADGAAPGAAIPWLWLWLGATALGVLRLVVWTWQLVRFCRRHSRRRRVGSVRVIWTEEIRVPFSFRLGWAPFVVLPENLQRDAPTRRLALRHEGEHHRCGDTWWSWGLQWWVAAFPWHPAFWWMRHRLEDLQELACDESLLGRRRLNPLAYARCLLQVATGSLSSPPPPGGASAMAAGRRATFLHRRVTMILKQRPSRTMVQIGRMFGVMGALLLGGAALASQSWVRDREVTLERAQRWVPARSSGFPLVVNDRVLAELNRFVGTPAGREFFRKALARKRPYEALLAEKIRTYAVPPEVLAIALVESGFANLQSHVNPVGAAGLWQIISRTARNYSLVVNDEVDERLDPAKATDAGLRYLKALHLRFQDWGLALLGYNAGEGLVQRAIDRTGSRNVWELLDKGFEGDRNYVPRVVAAALLLQNPEVMD